MKETATIDDYTLLYECGRGAFGTVYLARDSQDRHVALKMISLLGDTGDRELQALECYRKCSDHDHMLQVFEVVQKKGPPPFFYYTMEPADNMAGGESSEYVPCTLAEVLKRQKTLTVRQTTELISQILEDLAVIHGNHLVHRDIKPANIFWVNKRAKLGDMGLLANEHSLTCNAGSPGFMPPADSGIDVNSTAVDLFAITRLIYVCLSGNPVNYYPNVEPTDDIMEHGMDLLRIMNLETSRLPEMSVAEFQDILCPRRKITVLMENFTIENSIGSAFGRTAAARTESSIQAETITESCSCTASETESLGSLSSIRNKAITESCSCTVSKTESLDSLSSIQNNTSADSWLKKHAFAGLTLAATGIAAGVAAAPVAGTLLAAGTLVAGAPLVAGAATAAYLIKKLKKKE